LPLTRNVDSSSQGRDIDPHGVGQPGHDRLEPFHVVHSTMIHRAGPVAKRRLALVGAIPGTVEHAEAGGSTR
jgi:hypothetical protein